MDYFTSAECTECRMFIESTMRDGFRHGQWAMGCACLDIHKAASCHESSTIPTLAVLCALGFSPAMQIACNYSANITHHVHNT